MFFRALLTYFAFCNAVDAYGAIPSGVVKAPEEFTFGVPNRQTKEFKTLLSLSKIGSESWYNTREDNEFGISREWLIEAKAAWMKHDWRKEEKLINSNPNFMTTVDDPELGSVKIHFTALFSTKPDALPLIMLHGWPGSFLEFLPVLDLLKEKYTADTLPYHVIVPSLPDFGLSGGPSNDVELTVESAARLMDQLMLDLGFGQGYVAQGGDVGSFLTRIMSATSAACKAFHVNFLSPDSLNEIPLMRVNATQVEVEHLEKMTDYGANGSAYIMVQGQRPSTFGLILSSNPLAMLTWIGEKVIAWSDERYPLALETVLPMVSFYWYTDSSARSLYIYPAVARGRARNELLPVATSLEKPLGYSVFPAENLFLPEAYAEEIYPNMVYYNRVEKGGHFAAAEQPEIFLREVETFLKQVRPSIGI
ncbi:epoxide hydrolase [Ilyonectria destructans]|nr:epoxide hydrolase [Ilyonectria destructans]